jgi:sulfur-carrier protein adenylyltransferase/sulfurtransferase
MELITPAELAAKLRSPAPPRLLDVREAPERDLVAIQPSRWIPLGDLAARVGELDDWAGDEVVVYCHHGIRSARAAAFLESLGFDRVANLAGGVDRWSFEVDPNAPRY